MRSIRATDLKAKLASVLGDVERGEVVEVTRHGKTIARLTPPLADEAERRQTAVERLKAWRKTLPPTGIALDDILSAHDEGRSSHRIG